MAAGHGDPMNSPTSSGRKVRAGLFEIDLAAGQLHKNGRRLPLQEQPFRVLATLLEHPGDVVTRQELKERLWPADTYVGFDEGLNTAIRKLRTAFGDSAGNPRFIETLPRRGYRFIAPITETMPADGLPSSMEVRGDGHRLRATLRSSRRAFRSKLSGRQLLRSQAARKESCSGHRFSGFGSHRCCIRHAQAFFPGLCSC